jgi:hypothetical protein
MSDILPETVYLTFDYQAKPVFSCHISYENSIFCWRLPVLVGFKIYFLDLWKENAQSGLI